MIDEIDAKQREILHLLSLVSEGETATYDKPSIKQGHAESCPPPGFREDENSDLDPAVSLMAYHRCRLESLSSASVHVRERAIAEAERDYQTSHRRPPAYIGADSVENAEERDQAILRHVGCTPTWVSVFEACSETYVVALRRRNGRDPLSGTRSVRITANVVRVELRPEVGCGL